MVIFKLLIKTSRTRKAYNIAEMDIEPIWDEIFNPHAGRVAKSLRYFSGSLMINEAVKLGHYADNQRASILELHLNEDGSEKERFIYTEIDFYEIGYGTQMNNWKIKSVSAEFHAYRKTKI